MQYMLYRIYMHCYTDGGTIVGGGGGTIVGGGGTLSDVTAVNDAE